MVYTSMGAFKMNLGNGSCTSRSRPWCGSGSMCCAFATLVANIRHNRINKQRMCNLLWVCVTSYLPSAVMMPRGIKLPSGEKPSPRWTKRRQTDLTSTATGSGSLDFGLVTIIRIQKFADLFLDRVGARNLIFGECVRARLRNHDKP